MPADEVPAFDLYGTLGVATSALPDEIEVAYRRAAKRDHPDTSADPDGATRRMQRLNVAHDWLADPGRRARYDQVRGVGRPPVHLADVDPLGPWPDARGGRPTAPLKPSCVMPTIALIALMLIIGGLVAGQGSYLAIAVVIAAAVVCLFASLVTILGWLR